MLLLGKHTIDEVKSNDIDKFEYAPVMPDDTWKIDMVKELIEVRENQASIENFSADDIEDILEHLCISLQIFFLSLPYFRSFLGDLLFCHK